MLAARNHQKFRARAGMKAGRLQAIISKTKVASRLPSLSVTTPLMRERRTWAAQERLTMRPICRSASPRIPPKLEEVLDQRIQPCGAQ
jgi:hypothetical protein